MKNKVEEKNLRKVSGGANSNTTGRWQAYCTYCGEMHMIYCQTEQEAQDKINTEHYVCSACEGTDFIPKEFL